jgi:predicted dehydrogenase
MSDSHDNTKLDRRTFLTAGVVASSAIASSALSYGRILGANDRIGLGHIGVGNRGSGLHMMTSRLKDQYNVETVAVCDLWTRNRDRAVANSERYYGHAPRAFQHLEELLALKEVDAVLIATPEHSHSPVLKSAVEAGKDAYCEKPMGNVLREVKAARDAVKQSRRVVQIGTQHRSEPYQLAAREVLRSGALGEVSKYEIVWNYNGPRWRGRPEVKLVREADVDWKKWLMTKPYRPFDPQLYFEFRLYREFSSGIPDQWMSHGIDLVHFFMNDQPPRSVVAHGGVFAWHDGRENPDTFHALVEYPSMLASYSTSFGNDSDSFSRIMGKKATLVNIGGEGSPRWKLVEEKGNHEDNPTIARAERWVTLPGDDKPGPINIGDEDLSHLTNWFECLRSRNTKTNATVDNGFLHSVAIIMAAQSYWQGKRLYYDAASEQIKDSPPASSSAAAHG